MTVWHVNADEIPVVDYNDGVRTPGSEASFERESTALPIYEPGPYRASDHDPVIVGLVFDSDDDGVPDGDDACPATAIPEGGVPSIELRGKRWALVDGDGMFDTAVDAKETYTVVETGGCSCEQIIDRTGAGLGHRKFGCSNSLIKEWIAGRR